MIPPPICIHSSQPKYISFSKRTLKASCQCSTWNVNRRHLKHWCDTLNIPEDKQKGSEEQLCFKDWESSPLHSPYSTTVIYKIVLSTAQDTVQLLMFHLSNSKKQREMHSYPTLRQQSLSLTWKHFITFQ